MFYVKDSSSIPSRLYAIEAIKILAFRAKHWLHELLSTLISLANIANADLTSLKLAPVFSAIKCTQNGESVSLQNLSPQAIQYLDFMQTLNSYSLALASVLTGVNNSFNGGVPLTLTTSSFNSAKGMILGTFKTGGEEDEDELYFQNDLQKIDLSESPRREAGWIIFEGLIHLGN